MATFSWLAEIEKLQPPVLTVRAQTLSPNDNGRLIWDQFFPRQDVDSVDLNDMTALDDRLAADRREWNAQGRFIPLLTPEQRLLSIVPIEAYDKIDEREMQKLMEGSFGNASVVETQISARIPDRSDRLAMTDYRRLELDAMQAWTTGQITQRNPQNASQTFTASFGFDAARLATASPTWVAATSAYDEFLTWYEAGIEACGPGVGAAMRLATLRAILADAPDLPGGVSMTRTQLAQRVEQDTGSPFEFFVIENSIDIFTDGGTAYTRTKIWPAEQVAFIPQGFAVGYSAFAPVVRAMDLASQVPDAGIDIRGITVYYDPSNADKELTIQAQMNAMPVPNENLVWVIDAGV